MNSIKIISLEYEHESDGRRVVSFADGINLLVSNVNSVGKTTLLRLLLYALGFDVKGTAGVDFDYLKYNVSLNNYCGNMISIERNEFGENAPITVIENNHRYILSPCERDTIPSRFVFGVENKSIMRNILGAFYFDQEKGWVVLNRGRIIGKSVFSIEDFLCGLDDNDISGIKSEIIKLKNELLEYKSIYGVAKLVTTPYSNRAANQQEDFSDSIEKTKSKISSIDAQYKYFSHEVDRLKRIFNENKAIGDYVASLHLCISHNGESLPVTQDNILSFKDNQDFLHRRMKALNKQLAKLEAERNKLANLLEESRDDELLINNYKQKIAKAGISLIDLESAMDSVKAKVLALRKELQLLMSKTYHKELNEKVRYFLEKLHIRNPYANNFDILLTHNLYPLSGAELYKHIIAFKFSYILAIGKKYNIALPIIIDSPYAHELDSDNFDNVISILKEHFSKHQIIVASIRDELSCKHRRLVVSQGVLEYDLVVEDV